jgi:CheY-like chemotaxis protein
VVHVLAVADTDSYLKWSAATLAGLPADWSSTQVLLRNAVMPSPAQVEAASSATPGRDRVRVLGLPALLALLARERPDVLLLACTGPVVSTLTRLRRLRGPQRPVLLTGLPGISIPASRRAVLLRRACDLFVVHSHRERHAFVEAAAEVAPGLDFALARLPFLPAAEAGVRSAAAPDPEAPLVFAAQALVPRDRADREAVLRALAAAAPAVVKLRAGAGEQQTHRETYPYDVLWSDLVARGEVTAGSVGFVTGSMGQALDASRGLVTVSSTAALEAIAAGRPLLVVDDFGISAELINLVFEGSGCTGGLAGLASEPLHTPDPGWLVENYFHPDEDSDWLVRLDHLVSVRAAGRLPAPCVTAPTTRAQLLRQYLRLGLSVEQLARSDRALRRLGRLSRAPRALGRRARGRLRGRPAAPAPVGPPPAPPVGRRPPPPATPRAPADRGR